MTTVPDTKAMICVDMGTTNTRVWLVNEGRIVTRNCEQIGLRDAARVGSKSPVREALRQLISTARLQASEMKVEAGSVLAAGMLTSALGLCEVPHRVAPIDEGTLAHSLHTFFDPEITDLPFYLVPGVRSGLASPAMSDLENTDLMRGEETLIFGMLHAGVLSGNTTLLSLGSHWKAVSIDVKQRIASSFTTLSGELLHALQTQTVLASALSQGRFEELDAEWFERGREFEIRNGTGRALFGVRLLEQIFRIGPTELGSFLLGAVVEADRKSMGRAGFLENPLVITGTGAVPNAWQKVLKEMGRECTYCDPESTERAFILGLVRLSQLYLAQH